MDPRKGGSVRAVRSDEISFKDRDEVDREIFIGTTTDSREVEEVFENSKYFGGSGSHYTAKGIDVEITDQGIEYTVDEDIDDKVVTEFVDGIIRSFDDVDQEFRSQVTDRIYDDVSEIRTDGGKSVYSEEEGFPDYVGRTVKDSPDEESGQRQDEIRLGM